MKLVAQGAEPRFNPSIIYIPLGVRLTPALRTQLEPQCFRGYSPKSLLQQHYCVLCRVVWGMGGQLCRRWRG